MSVCLCVYALLFEPFDMTYEIQSKTSVCLSIIMERSRSKSCAQQSGAFNYAYNEEVLKISCFSIIRHMTDKPQNISPRVKCPLRTERLRRPWIRDHNHFRGCGQIQAWVGICQNICLPYGFYNHWLRWGIKGISSYCGKMISNVTKVTQIWEFVVSAKWVTFVSH